MIGSKGGTTKEQKDELMEMVAEKTKKDGYYLMLNNEVFIDKIADLMAWYVNFQFRIYDIDSKTQAKSPSLQYQVWYKAFKDFSDEDFSVIVDGYMKENVYPPSSPTSLLEYAKKILVQQNKGNIDKVWVDLKTMITLNGFKIHKQWSPIDNDYVYFKFFKICYQRLW